MATIDEDLATLEKDIRQLKGEYDQYFGGGRKRPPTEIEWRIDMMVKRYSDAAAFEIRAEIPRQHLRRLTRSTRISSRKRTGIALYHHVDAPFNFCGRTFPATAEY